MNLGGVKLPRAAGAALRGGGRSPSRSSVLGGYRRARSQNPKNSRNRRSLLSILKRDAALAGNPLPLGLSVGSVLGKLTSLPGLRRFDPKKHAIRVAHMNQLAEKALSGSPTERKDAIAALQLTATGTGGGGVAIYKETREHATQLLQHIAAQRPTAAPAAAAGLSQVLASPLAGIAVREVAKAATRRPRAPRRQRYPTYVDRYGRQRYSTKPPGSEMRLPAGAQPVAGTPYSFFRGAVGKGGVGTTAGQLAVAGAAGVAAYLVTQRVLQHLGGRAQSKEEAGVNAALAFRQARADFQASQGRAMNAAERRAAGDAYKAQLVELGYDPVTFTRQRGRVAEFLETYNPLGG